MVTGSKFIKDDESLEVYHTMYRSIIGSLLYVTSTILDVMQVVGLVSIFQSTPKETHVAAIKIILKYIKGTMDYGLWYPKRDNFTKAFTNVDWEGSIDDKKITSGAAFYLGYCLVPWISKKQSSISLSTT